MARVIREDAETSGCVTVVTALRIEALSLGGRTVHCGMGPARAAACGVELARALPPGHPVAIAGVAGGLDPALPAGALVVACEVAKPGKPATALPHARALAEILDRAGVEVYLRPVVTTDRLVRGATRRQLASGGAAAVDMESASLMESLPGRPLVVVRALADTPTVGMLRGGVRGLLALRRVRSAVTAWAAALDAGGGAHPG